MQANPFLKWAGGKRQLLSHLLPLVPARYSRYLEPFIGGGALYFATQPRVAFIADANRELVTTYEVVRDKPEALVARLTEHRTCHNQDYYYQLRAEQPTSPLEVAARFIYLNKTCFNGLYRVNRSGQYNVPIGSYKNPQIFDRSNLLACASALKSATIRHADYRETLQEAKSGDFVYLDPPYAPLSPTSSFTSYTKDEFGERQQRELAQCYRELDRRGCYVMLSNSSAQLILDIYQGFDVRLVAATRMINSKADGRGMVNEVVILNYQPPASGFVKVDKRTKQPVNPVSVGLLPANEDAIGSHQTEQQPSTSTYPFLRIR